MAIEFLNTLFVLTEGAYVHLDGETVRVESQGTKLKQVPLHTLGSIVVFGLVSISPYLMRRCAEDGRAISYMDINGRFLARVVGRETGNVLLRKAQFVAHSNHQSSCDIARSIVAGKLQNSRGVLARAVRDNRDMTDGSRSDDRSTRLQTSLDEIAILLKQLPVAASLDTIRGIEGNAAANYFEAFDSMILQQRTDFRFDGRSRRPPRDRVNALLSFLYALLANDCRAAVEAVGLDSQIGFLHALRPGRQALAMDLMEEFRAPIADRLALTLINRKQVNGEDFKVRPGDSVLLTEDGRKKVIVAYQKRKQTLVTHPCLKSKIPLGLIPHLQARILARHIRGDLNDYTPYLPG